MITAPVGQPPLYKLMIQFAASVLIAFGAVLILYFLRALFGIGIGSPGVTALVGSAAALILIPTEYANRRRERRRRR